MPAAVAQNYNQATTITKSDTVNIDGTTDSVAVATGGGLACPYRPKLTEAVYVGGAGIVVGVFADGSTSNFTAVAGEILPIQIKRVNSTTTTATLMSALWNV